MNIFVTSDDPVECAQNLDDKRLVKMVLETAQLLSTAMHVMGRTDAPYKKTHANHPCSIWTRASKGNYRWLENHFNALCNEYSLRYGKMHKCEALQMKFNFGRDSMPDGELTPFVNCSQFKDIETKLAYRLTMISKWTKDEENKRPPRWTKSMPPDWLIP